MFDLKIAKSISFEIAIKLPWIFATVNYSMLILVNIEGMNSFSKMIILLFRLKCLGMRFVMEIKLDHLRTNRQINI